MRGEFKERANERKECTHGDSRGGKRVREEESRTKRVMGEGVSVEEGAIDIG